MENNRSLHIIAFVNDLMFGSKLEIAARNQNYQLTFWGTEAEISDLEENENAPPGEQINGRLGTLFAKLTTLQPALLIFDLTNPAIPWRRWVMSLKSSPATRRIPILCYGPHVETETLKAALEAGADGVVVRSRLAKAFPELVQQYARIPDYALLHDSCTQPLPAKAIAGLEAFNNQAYFDAHEELEHAWQAESGPGRELFRALLQIAVAYLQIERQNYKGTIKMFLRARQWLQPLPDHCRGVNIAKVRLDAEKVYTQLVELGAENIASFDFAALPPVEYHLSAKKDSQN